ncbi:PREDICTED: glycine-rich selenoprotein-like [Nicrophorus vespilloides]|uniref:Glycine-rich selenoprotein-like n=1 Tax=Nicrophorus vespilloides TaxID=110193 RepID=A0ABM1MWU8_NICVS|nr:PREDICTED: glycine-rich selenoprotein-like [Nicrophorus vespilloides]
MVYVSPDGTVHQSRPWNFGRLVDAFWGTLDFISMFFKSLFGLDRGRISNGRGGGGGSGGSGGPGNGPPRGPKKFGQIKTIQDCSMPGGG